MFLWVNNNPGKFNTTKWNNHEDVKLVFLGFIFNIFYVAMPEEMVHYCGQ